MSYNHDDALEIILQLEEILITIFLLMAACIENNI